MALKDVCSLPSQRAGQCMKLSFGSQRRKVLREETATVNFCSSPEIVKNRMRKGEVYFSRDKKSILYQQKLETTKRSCLSRIVYIGDHDKIGKGHLERHQRIEALPIEE